jgi:2-oxoglutarate ferredoxin oxidoreductase subunit alpha
VNGVSSFQVHISDHDITTPGDAPSVLVAMNPAALKADLHRLEKGGSLIVNIDTFDERNLEKAGYRRTRSTTARSPATRSSRCR